MTQEEKIEDAQLDQNTTEADDAGQTEPVAKDTEPAAQQAVEAEESAPADEPSHTPAVSEDELEDAEDLAEEQDTETPEDFVATLETVIEAVLCVKALNQKYRDNGRAFRIEKISGGYQMMTLAAFNSWISKLIKVRSDNKLTPASLECLAIVAYKQPIIRADIEAIRGVASGEVLRNLMYKGMVKIVGRAEILGRPMLYGTTKKFLDVFGLANLKDLPKIEELKKPE
ncbi:MAG: SMC-Scp complex subunit ScpB [Planctomycetota bacterium]